MATLTKGKVVIDEIILDDDDDDEQDDDNEDSNDSDSMKEDQIEQGRAYENGDDDEMDYDEISQVNQPVDFIFAVEDDDGVETEFNVQKVFSNELNENNNHESPAKTTPPDNKSLSSQPSTAQPIRTRSALRSQSNSQSVNTNSTSIPSTSNGTKKKVKLSETAETIPAKQLRSSVRETRSVQNKTTQPNPSEPKTGNKKSTNTPLNTSTTSTTTTTTTNNNNTTLSQSIPSVNKKMSTNSNSSTSTVPKNGKKSVITNKVAIATPSTSSPGNRTTVTTNGKQNGMPTTSTTITTNGTNKMNKNSTEIPPVTDGKTVIPKKRNKSYWNGKEHLKQLGPEAPYVMLDRLSLFLSGQTEYRGHDCLKTVCPAKRKKAKSPVPPPRIGPLFGNISSTIDNVAKDVSINVNIPPGQPRIGQKIRFQFWQTPLGNNIPTKSSIQNAKIIGYDEQYNLYEIQLFHYDHPFVIRKDKSKNQRIPTNTMLIDWNSLADPVIV